MTAAALAAALAASAAAAPPPRASPSVEGLSRPVDAAERKRALLLADLLIDEKRLDEADRLVAERLASDPERTPWLTRRARVESARGRHARAVELYREASRLQPDDGGILLQLGLALWRAEDLPGARKTLEAARVKSKDPEILFHLSELASVRGDPGEARRLARLALDELPDTPEPHTARLRLRLRVVLGWDDSIDRDYRALFERSPAQVETLFDWAEALIRSGFPLEAEEPLRLARERFPDAELRARQLESYRLQKAGLRARRETLLEESAAVFPGEPAFMMPLAEARFAELRGREAESLLGPLIDSPAYARQADELRVEVRRAYDHHLGPLLRLRSSEHSSSTEEGLSYRGWPTTGWRVHADAGTQTHSQPSRGFKTTLAGGQAQVSRERRLWALGAAADLRSGRGFTAAAPGLRARWTPAEQASFELHAWRGRAWTESPETVEVRAVSDEVQLSADARPLPRLYLGGYGKLTEHRLPDGTRARRATAAPETTFSLRRGRGWYLAAGYRFVMESTSGDPGFFQRLALIGRSRTHYLTLPFGARWDAGRSRFDGYLFNGHDNGRGRSFGRGDLAGAGLAFETDLREAWRVLAGWEFSRDAASGVTTGRSHAARLSLQHHWR